MVDRCGPQLVTPGTTALCLAADEPAQKRPRLWADEDGRAPPDCRAEALPIAGSGTAGQHSDMKFAALDEWGYGEELETSQMWQMELPVLPTSDPRELSDVLRGPDGQSSGCWPLERSSSWSCAPDLNHQSTDPAALLTCALWSGQPERHLGLRTPLRMSRKRGRRPGEVLAILRRRPFDHGMLCRWVMTCSAQTEVAYWIRKASKCTFHEARAEARRMWAGMNAATRMSWRFVCDLMKHCHMSNPGGARVTKEAPDGSGCGSDNTGATATANRWEAPGFLMTFNTFIGLNDRVFLEACSEAESAQDIMDLVRASASHMEHYDEFREWVRALATRLQLASWSCCMEASLSGSTKGRVHLHAFIGPPLSQGLLGALPRSVELVAADVRWGDVMPAVSILRGRRGQALKRAVGGWFYCIGPKVGSVRRDSHKEPFQETITVLSFRFALAVSLSFQQHLQSLPIGFSVLRSCQRQRLRHCGLPSSTACGRRPTCGVVCRRVVLSSGGGPPVGSHP